MAERAGSASLCVYALVENRLVFWKKHGGGSPGAQLILLVDSDGLLRFGLGDVDRRGRKHDLGWFMLISCCLGYHLTRSDSSHFARETPSLFCP